MNNRRFSICAVAFGFGVAAASAGCLGSDPYANSQLLRTPPGVDAHPSTGGGGSGGGGGGQLGAIVGTPLATFNADRESFVFSMYNGDAPMNLVVNHGADAPTLTWDPADGSPSGGGSLKVVAPFSGANQYVDVQSPSYPMTNLQNFAGGKLHVRVKVDAGSTFSGQVEPYVDTGSAYAFVGTSVNAAMGNDWHDYVVDLDTAMTHISGYDLTKVILIGVHIGSGGAGMNATPVTFHIDSFSIEGGMPTVSTPDAGGGGAGGGGAGGGDAAAATDGATAN
jgi:hypothetical protein